MFWQAVVTRSSVPAVSRMEAVTIPTTELDVELEVKVVRGRWEPASEAGYGELLDVKALRQDHWLPSEELDVDVGVIIHHPAHTNEPNHTQMPNWHQSQ